MTSVRYRGLSIHLATGVVWFSISYGRHAFDVMPLRGWSKPRVRSGHVFTMWRIGPFKYTRFCL